MCSAPKPSTIKTPVVIPRIRHQPVGSAVLYTPADALHRMTAMRLAGDMMVDSGSGRSCVIGSR